jgi:phage terminase large subunit-like protein
LRIELLDRALAGLSKDEAREARLLAEEYERRVRDNPLLRYTPHPKQAVFHGSHEPAKCFLGGNRSGKTTAGILDDLIQAVDLESVPESLVPYKVWTPPFYCRIVSPDFTSTMEGVIFQKLREWVPRGQLAGDSWSKAYDKQRRRLSFKNGSWFDFMTFEQDLDKFGGAALHRVHYDEEPPRLIRQESLMRLIDFGGDELFTMTPLHGMSWMFDEFYDPWERGVLVDAAVVVVDMDDNPYLDAKTKLRVLAGLSEEERAARKGGRFVHFAGLVYGEFRRALHVVPWKEFPKGATVVGAIDPGTRHMAAVVWAYLGVDDDLVVFDEACLQGATVAQVCKQIKLVERKHELGHLIYVIDPAARNVMHQTGRSDQMEYMDHGVITILGQNAVTAGINRVKERLETDRLHVMANCSTTIEQFRRYRWTTPSRSEHDAKEQVVKRDDHTLDALRYLVMSRPQKQVPRPDLASMTPAERAMWREMHSGQRRTPLHQFGAIYN